MCGWALQEASLAYEAQVYSQKELKSDDYLRLQPFGQVPFFEDDRGLRLFETGAILLHIAESCETLMPTDANAQARVKTWLFAALNTIEPPIQNLAAIDFFNAKEEWAKLRRPAVVEAVQAKLKSLAAWMEGRDYLEGRFTVADLLMTTVLGNLRHTDLVTQVPVLDRYRQRCEARPAFARALADHMKPFADSAPGGELSGLVKTSKWIPAFAGMTGCLSAENAPAGT